MLLRAWTGACDGNPTAFLSQDAARRVQSRCVDEFTMRQGRHMRVVEQILLPSRVCCCGDAEVECGGVETWSVAE